MKNDEKWQANYEALKAYIDEHHQMDEHTGGRKRKGV